MKLRNKKTGEINKSIQISTFDGYKERYYSSLAELNAEWEDYTPKEPLFTDEKIRKAVRAWAEANDVQEVDYWNSDYRFQDVQGVSSISFEKNPIETKNRYGDDVYTITELCGGEE